MRGDYGSRAAARVHLAELAADFVRYEAVGDRPVRLASSLALVLRASTRGET